LHFIEELGEIISQIISDFTDPGDALRTDKEQ